VGSTACREAGAKPRCPGPELVPSRGRADQATMAVHKWTGNYRTPIRFLLSNDGKVSQSKRQISRRPRLPPLTETPTTSCPAS